MSDGYYYLHTNKCLIYKKNHVESDFLDSDFVVKHWKIDITSRLSAWTIIIESLALGADLDCVKSLCDKWKCDIEDLHNYLRQDRANNSDLKKGGVEKYLTQIAGYENSIIYWNWLASTPFDSNPDLTILPKGIKNATQSV